VNKEKLIELIIKLLEMILIMMG